MEINQLAHGGQAKLGFKFFGARNNSGESLCSCEL